VLFGASSFVGRVLRAVVASHFGALRTPYGTGVKIPLRPALAPPLTLLRTGFDKGGKKGGFLFGIATSAREHVCDPPVQEEETMAVIEVVEERFERRLSEEIGKLRTELSGEMSKLRVEMHDLRANLI
jgi:hypothetical protein